MTNGFIQPYQSEQYVGENGSLVIHQWIKLVTI